MLNIVPYSSKIETGEKMEKSGVSVLYAVRFRASDFSFFDPKNLIFPLGNTVSIHEFTAENAIGFQPEARYLNRIGNRLTQLSLDFCSRHKKPVYGDIGIGHVPPHMQR